MERANAIVGQSGGPTVAVNATLAGVIRGCLVNSEVIDILYGAVNGIEGILEGRTINLTRRFAKGEEELSLLEHTPAAALGSCRQKLPALDAPGAAETYESLFSFFKEKNIRYFFYIGGNDSMDTVDKLSSYAEKTGADLVCIGIPKTIDNDLTLTDHCPGYGSAAKYIATCVSEILRDCAVYTVRALTIVEIMGRDAGWLTAAAALPRLGNLPEPDYVYLPECAFSKDAFLEDIEAAFKRHPNVVVAVSEGLRDAQGNYVGADAQSGTLDVFGHRYLSGTGKALEVLAAERLSCKCRSIELNILQRCAAHMASATDIAESVQIGRAAVKTAVEGKSNVMLGFERGDETWTRCAIRTYPVADIANRIKFVPREFINERGNGVTDACLQYIRPLILGEAKPPYEDGLPKQFIF